LVDQAHLKGEHAKEKVSFRAGFGHQ